MDFGERTQVRAWLMEVLAAIMVYLGILYRFRQSIAYVNQVIYAYYYFYNLILYIVRDYLFMLTYILLQYRIVLILCSMVR